MVGGCERVRERERTGPFPSYLLPRTLLLRALCVLILLPSQLVTAFHVLTFIGQGKKDIVCRFIIEYSSLRDFYRLLGKY
jgi:hypothetical protein